MEEGSLLREVLSQERGSSVLQNSLLVNVFLLQEKNQDPTSIDALLALAKLSTRLNQYLGKHYSSFSSSSRSSHYYPWIQGGEGPVFGIHVDSQNDKIPHLRAQCRYSVAVADEWAMIRCMLQFTRDNDTNDDQIVVECWDEDDGQVLLIEAAHVLPSWVDEIGPNACRYLCWIQNGRIVLLAPKGGSHGAASGEDVNLTRAQALQLLQRNDQSSCRQSIPSIDNAIQERIDSVFANPLTHRAAVAVPVAVAHLLGQRPELLPVAISAWADSVQSSRHDMTTSRPVGEVPEHLMNDWQWTVQTFGRLTYAQSRTVVSAEGDWNTPDAIPHRYQKSPSIRRLKVQAQNHATPHLQHAVALGVRVVAGLELLLLRQTTLPLRLFSSESEERVLNHWIHIDSALNNRKGDWLRQAWAAGPHHAEQSLEDVIKCPVYFPEVHNQLYPLMFPMKSVGQIIQSYLRASLDEPFGEAVAPSREQIDEDDSWLFISEEKQFPEFPIQHKEEAGEMQQVLDGFQNFMAGESQFEGVENKGTPSDEKDYTSSHDAKERNVSVHIRPAAVLHLMRETLAAPTVKHLESYLRQPPQTRDLYFSEEDYTLMESEDDGSNTDEEMVTIMEQMDHELNDAAAGASRSVDGIDGEIVQDESVAEGAHILSNLIESVDASAGGPGPVRNILGGMGQKTI